MSGPPEAPLRPEDEAELAALLSAKIAALEQSLPHAAAEAKPVSLGLAIGRLGRMDEMQQQQMALARRQRALLQLGQLRAAAVRLAEGNYGDCDQCGEPIGRARLLARPQATVCGACQRAAEG